MSDPGFRIAKILDHGTGHPAIARLVFQISHLVGSGFTGISKEQEGSLTELLMEIAQEIIYVEARLNAAVALEERFFAEVRSGTGVKRQPHALSFTDPTLALRKEFEDGIIHLAIAHRKIARAAGMILQKEIKGGNALVRELRRVVPEGDANLEWLQDADEWFTAFYSLRGDIEHEEVDITPCAIGVNPDGTFEPVPATITATGIRMVEWLQGALSTVFIFAEDSLILSIDRTLPEWIVLRHIRPRDDRGFAYDLTLAGHSQNLPEEPGTA